MNRNQKLAAATLWLLALTLAARLDPAAVQLLLILTCFSLLLANLGTRLDGPSAYSVFNPGHQPLLGQLSPDQFDNEIRRRPTAQTSDPRHNAAGSAGAPPRPGIASSVAAPASTDELLESVRREILADARRAPRVTRPLLRRR